MPVLLPIQGLSVSNIKALPQVLLLKEKKSQDVIIQQEGQLILSDLMPQKVCSKKGTQQRKSAHILYHFRS